MAKYDPMLPIGIIAKRTGLTVSAVRYYEDVGLLTSVRDRAGRRRFARSQIRRLSFILIAQRLGLSLKEISDLLDALPNNRTPTAGDWREISNLIGAQIDERIKQLERMRARLSGCIGCGCLSLETCEIYNSGDHMGQEGPGPRRI